MQFHNESSDLYIPDGRSLPEALSRSTHVAVGAHSDDLEIMAYHGIAACYGRRDQWFFGVTCTNGAGSSRKGIYADYSDEDMIEVRREEQRRAAHVGQYAGVAQLDYPSSATKDASDRRLGEDLEKIFLATRPKTVYTHQPADKHETHIGVLAAVLTTLRGLPSDARPERLIGCEVWRNLDWMDDGDKVGLDVSARPNLSATLVGIFDSQISGGKRYDLATVGRWQANATYFDSHGSDTKSLVAYAMDLTPLLEDPTRSIVDFTLEHLDRFRADVEGKLRGRFGA